MLLRSKIWKCCSVVVSVSRTLMISIYRPLQHCIAHYHFVRWSLNVVLGRQTIPNLSFYPLQKQCLAALSYIPLPFYYGLFCRNLSPNTYVQVGSSVKCTSGAISKKEVEFCGWISETCLLEHNSERLCMSREASIFQTLSFRQRKSDFSLRCCLPSQAFVPLVETSWRLTFYSILAFIVFTSEYLTAPY